MSKEWIVRLGFVAAGALGGVAVHNAIDKVVANRNEAENFFYTADGYTISQFNENTFLVTKTLPDQQNPLNKFREEILIIKIGEDLIASGCVISNFEKTDSGGLISFKNPNCVNELPRR